MVPGLAQQEQANAFLGAEGIRYAKPSDSSARRTTGGVVDACGAQFQRCGTAAGIKLDEG